MVQLRVRGLGERNLFRRYIWIAIVVAGTVAAMLAFTPASEWAEMGAIFGLGLLVFAAQLVPTARRLILGHRRAVIAIGIAATAGSLLLIFATLSSPSSVDPAWGGMVAVYLMLIGPLVIFLPFMAKRMERELAVLKATGVVAQPTPGTFSPGAEVRDILAELISQKGALVRVVGPWFLLFCVPPMVFINVDYWKALADRDRSFAAAILLGLVVVVLAEIALLLVAMIQWTRFTATKQEPRLRAFPGKALWGWVWRWVIYGALFRFVGEMEPWMKGHLPGAAQWQLDGLQGLAGFVALVLFSPFALVLPAVALGAADTGITASMRGYRLVGRKYYLGAALILAPYTLASWGLGILSDHLKGPAVAVACVGAWVILWFLTTIVGMTYLTRIYLRGVAAAPSAA
jgi:hypothetical protein